MKQREIVTNQHTPRLSDQGYELLRGWDTSLAAAIVERSREPHILHSTPRDASQRFPTLEAAEQWHDSHERIVYGLFHAVELSGLIWYNKAPLPSHDADVTFAIRLYDGARGKGLGRPFLEATEVDYREQTDYDGPIWLSTALDNTVAQSLYLRTGYQPVAERDERLIMIKEDPA